MCFLAEVGMLIFGIITLVKGKFSLSRGKVVTGTPAYVIGALLTATLPALFMLGVAIGVMAAAAAHQRHEPMPSMAALAGLDLAIVPVVLLVVVIIAAVTGKRPAPPSEPPQPLSGAVSPFRAADPSNPYASPQNQ